VRSERRSVPAGSFHLHRVASLQGSCLMQPVWVLFAVVEGGQWGGAIAPVEGTPWVVVPGLECGRLGSGSVLLQVLRFESVTGSWIPRLRRSKDFEWELPAGESTWGVAPLGMSWVRVAVRGAAESLWP
jgi:hypothetical protein